MSEAAAESGQQQSSAAASAPAAGTATPRYTQAQSPGKDKEETGLQKLMTQLKTNTLVPLLIAGAAAIALIVALFLWASSPTYRVLYNNLSEADGGTIINELDSRGIPYRLSAGGQAILVPSDQVHLLRLQLAEQGLPMGGNVGFELMDNQSFGISQFAEQVNYQRSLEGELSRSMESMQPVMRARVHLSMAKQSVFVRDREPAKASVVLTMHQGRTLAQNQISAITHLVASSVPELSSDDVTVVSASGELLSTKSSGRGIDGDNLSYALEVERRYQQRIENILHPLFGSRNIRIQVVADIDFALREETQESYRPNQSPNEAAVRSTQFSGALRGQGVGVNGIPGALSNTPPGWAPSPIDGPQDGDTLEEEDAADPERDLQYDNVVNYEVDRNITHIQHEQGRVRRVTVAAVVNYRNSLDEEGNPIMIPLSDEDMGRVNSLIQQAMGFSAERGDQIEVVNSPFADELDGDVDAPAWWETREAHDLILTLARYLLVLLVALLAYSKILKPLLQRLQPVAPAPATAGAPLGALAGSGIDTGIAVQDDDSDSRMAVSSGVLKRKRKSMSYEQDLDEVRDMAKEDPRLVAMVIRSWMSKNEQ